MVIQPVNFIQSDAMPLQGAIPLQGSSCVSPDADADITMPHGMPPIVIDGLYCAARANPLIEPLATANAISKKKIWRVNFMVNKN